MTLTHLLLLLLLPPPPAQAAQLQAKYTADAEAQLLVKHGGDVAQEAVAKKIKLAPSPFALGGAGAESAYVRKFRAMQTQNPSPEALKRITSDLKDAMRAKNGLFLVQPQRKDITHVDALLLGPEDTPYAGGFFHFELRFPQDYPWAPPMVLLRTTDGGACRFNPNLYADGKVCLSVLGTWPGPSWTPVQTLSSVLLSIMSLMNACPYHNEPGFNAERSPGDAAAYNQIIHHETLRVAVAGAMEAPTFPTECDKAFLALMRDVFQRKVAVWLAECDKHAPSLDGKAMADPFGAERGVFHYGDIRKRLEAVAAAIAAGQHLLNRGAAPPAAQ